MSDQPEHRLESLLKAYARRRREECGSNFEMHPATRRLLQAEIAAVYRKPTGRGSSWAWVALYTRFLPRVGVALAILLLLAIVVWPFRTAQKQIAGVRTPVLPIAKQLPDQVQPSEPQGAQRGRGDELQVKLKREEVSERFMKKVEPAAAATPAPIFAGDLSKDTALKPGMAPGISAPTQSSGMAGGLGLAAKDSKSANIFYFFDQAPTSSLESADVKLQPFGFDRDAFTNQLALADSPLPVDKEVGQLWAEVPTESKQKTARSAQVLDRSIQNRPLGGLMPTQEPATRTSNPDLAKAAPAAGSARGAEESKVAAVALQPTPPSARPARTGPPLPTAATAPLTEEKTKHLMESEAIVQSSAGTVASATNATSYFQSPASARAYLGRGSTSATASVRGPLLVSGQSREGRANEQMVFSSGNRSDQGGRLYRAVETPILNSFTLEQQGSRVMIRDGDGSVYYGQLLAEQVAGEKTELAPTKEWARAAQDQRRVRRSAATPETSMRGQFSFEARGTNISLQKPVFVTGTVQKTPVVAMAAPSVEAPSRQNEPIAGQTSWFGLKLDGVSQAAGSGSGFGGGPANSTHTLRFQGKAIVGNGPPVELDLLGRNSRPVP